MSSECDGCDGTGKRGHPATCGAEGGSVECWDCDGSGEAKLELPEGMPETVLTELVLRFVATMALADHMGDGWNYIEEFLEAAGIELKQGDCFDDDTPYKRTLDEMGVTVL